MSKRKIDVWLYDSHLTEDPNDSFGRVRSAGTITNKEIAELIKKEGTEYQLEAIIEILNRSDRICREALSEGYAINTDFVNARLGITGTFTEEKFNPSEHSVSVHMQPTSLVRNEIKTVPVQIMGKANTGPVISRVTDSFTGEVNATITPNNALTVSGDKIQVAGDHESVGVFFISLADGSRTKVSQIISNKNKELILMIPALASGDYELELVTQHNSSRDLLRDPRSEKLDSILTVL